MPIYEYECPSCCNVFEIFQRMTEDPLATCPDCSGPVKKLVSMSSFTLKGSGWYADGYSSKAAGESGSKPAASTTESSSLKPEKSAAAGSADSSSTSESKTSCPATAS